MDKAVLMHRMKDVKREEDWYKTSKKFDDLTLPAEQNMVKNLLNKYDEIVHAYERHEQFIKKVSKSKK